MVDKTSVVETAGVMKALKRAFPSDGFALFRAVAFGVLKDKWVVAFDQPPKTTTKQLVFSGTEVGGKGAWSSPVVVADDNCIFCGTGRHEKTPGCQNGKI